MQAKTKGNGRSIDGATSNRQQSRLNILGYSPHKTNIEAASFRRHSRNQFHVILSHQTAALDLLRDQGYKVHDEEDANVAVAYRQTTFTTMARQRVAHHEVVCGDATDPKECEASTFIFTLPLQHHWRRDGDEIGPNEITIAAVHVYHLTANARSDSEVLAEFAEILSTLPADVLYVDIGEMDMKALRADIPSCFRDATTPTVFWGCVKAVRFNVAFLLNFDRGFAKHLRIRKHGLPRMPVLEKQAFLRCLHITAKAASGTHMQPHEADACCVSSGEEARGQKRRAEESDDNAMDLPPKRLRSRDGSSGKFTIAVPPKPHRLVPPPPPPPPPPQWPPHEVRGYDHGI